MMRAMSEKLAREQLWHCIYQVRHVGVLVRACRKLEEFEADKKGLIDLVDELLEGQKGRKSLDDLLQEVEFSYSHLLKEEFPALEWDDRSVVHALLLVLKMEEKSKARDAVVGLFRKALGMTAKSSNEGVAKVLLKHGELREVLRQVGLEVVKS